MSKKQKPPANPFSNENRHRPMITISVAPETVERLDKLAKKLALDGRGRVVDQLAAEAIKNPVKNPVKNPIQKEAASE